MRAKLIGVVGVAAGVLLGLFAREGWDARARSRECCSSKRPTTAQTCPLHRGADGKMTSSDQAEVDRLRRAMRDGVFQPWVELGRAPTPDEIGQRLHLDAASVDKLMDEFEACGESFEVGIRRVPESDLIAVA